MYKSKNLLQKFLAWGLITSLMFSLLIPFSGITVKADDKGKFLEQIMFDNDRIEYVGTWNTVDNLQKRSNAIDAYAEFNFKGTGIEVCFNTGTGAGKFAVYIDGVFIEEIESQRPSPQPDLTLFQKYDLEDGNHTIKIVVTEARNINLRWFSVFGPPNPLDDEEIYCDDSKVAYEGEWLPGLFDNAKRSNIANSYAELEFEGRGIEVYFNTGPGGGFFDVYINDELKAENVDVYDPVGNANTLLFSAYDLENGTNKIQIVVKGQGNPSSNGANNVNLRRFVVLKRRMVMFNSNIITYGGEANDGAGSWFELDGVQKRTNTAGDYLEFDFTGVGIEVYLNTGPGAGLVDVYLNEKLASGEVNGYNPTGISNILLFKEYDLSPGVNTIKLVVRGEGKPPSTNANVNISKFVVVENANEYENKEDNNNDITNFEIASQVESIIYNQNKIIYVDMPFGTDVTKLSPIIETSENATITPESGAENNFTTPQIYTVTNEQGLSKEYTVIITILPYVPSSNCDILTFEILNQVGTSVINQEDKTVAINMPFGTNVTELTPTITISDKATVSPESETTQNFTNPVKYTITAEDNTTKEYIVTVTVLPDNYIPSDDCDITTFTILEQVGETVINQETRTIAINVPFGTNVTALTPTITISEKASVNPASGVAQNFTESVKYTVTAEDSTTTKEYIVTITVLPESNIPSTACDITAFTIPNQVGETVINQENRTIAINVPFGTNVTALTPTITISDKATVSPESETAQNFTNPVKYTVTAEDTTTTKEYTVTITVLPESNIPSTACDITALTIPNQVGETVINQETRTIAINMPFGTDITALTPTITISEKATVNPASGAAQNFTNPVKYTVTAEDTTTTKEYTVTITVLPESNIPSTACDITALTIPNQIGETVINQEIRTIAINMPFGTNITALTPTITTSEKATINPATGAAQNFTESVKYTVTAEDTTTTKEYTVTVTVLPSVEVPIQGVTLNRTTLTLNRGANSTLTATVNPTGATNVTRSWSSSRPSVATIDTNGRVTAIARGTAVITFTAVGANNSSFTTTCNVTVNQPATGVSVRNSTINLNVGKQTSVNASIAPSNANVNTKITYRSENTKIATVSSSGRITGKSAGRTNIVITGGGKTVKVRVNVKSNVTKITFKQSTISSRSRTINLTKQIRTITPAASFRLSTKYTWSSSNRKNARVSSRGVVTRVRRSRTTTITVRHGKKLLGRVKIVFR